MFEEILSFLEAIGFIYNEKLSLVMRKAVFGVSTRSYIKPAVLPQKMAKGLKFLDLGSRGIVLSTCRKIKGADQLHIYCAAYLHLCFHICEKPVYLLIALLTVFFRLSYPRKLEGLCTKN